MSVLVSERSALAGTASPVSTGTRWASQPPVTGPVHPRVRVPPYCSQRRHGHWEPLPDPGALLSPMEPARPSPPLRSCHPRVLWPGRPRGPAPLERSDPDRTRSSTCATLHDLTRPSPSSGASVVTGEGACGGNPRNDGPHAQRQAHGTRDQDWPGGAEGSGAGGGSTHSLQPQLRGTSLWLCGHAGPCSAAPHSERGHAAGEGAWLQEPPGAERRVWAVGLGVDLRVGHEEHAR